MGNRMNARRGVICDLAIATSHINRLAADVLATNHSPTHPRYHIDMHDDDHVCLCFHVSKRKIVNFCRREKPAVPSLISECLSAGTGCRWCVPFIEKLHSQVMGGEPEPDLPVSPQEYAKKRARYRATGTREQEAD